MLWKSYSKSTLSTIKWGHKATVYNLPFSEKSKFIDLTTLIPLPSERTSSKPGTSIARILSTDAIHPTETAGID